jgi:hypothetical protein
MVHINQNGINWHYLYANIPSGNPERNSVKDWRHFRAMKLPALRSTTEQGCQMVYFQTKNPKFWQIGMEKVGILILQLFGTFYGHLVI